MNKKILSILIIIFIINFSLSLYLQVKESQALPICGINLNSGCNSVGQSIYAQIFGIKLTLIGIFSFPILAILILLNYKKKIKHLEKLLTFILLVSGIFAARLLFIQFFVLKEICKYCLVIDTLTIASLVMFYFSKD